MFRRALGFALIAISVTATASTAQEKSAESPSPAAREALAVRFDVVSIKPANPDKDECCEVRFDTDEFFATETLRGLIYLAYFPMNMNDNDAVAGAPGWADKNLWHVEAKVAPEDMDTYQKHRPMLAEGADSMGKQLLQSMLADRFHLVVHRVPAQMDGYALVVGKNGPKVKEAAPDEPQPSGSIPMPGGGYMVGRRPDEYPHASFTAVTMSTFAIWLRNNGVAVVDRTGLTGKYDFRLNWLSSGPDEKHVGAVMFDDPDKLSHWNFGELGLRAEHVKLPTEHIVIDHVDPPSEN